jgi:hypothetical protein
MHLMAPAVVMSPGAMHLAADDLEAPEKYAIVALAGPQAQHHYCPMSRTAQNRAYDGS